MSETWIKAHLPLDGQGNVVLAKDVVQAGDSIVVTPAALAALTASVADVATHAKLSALAIAGEGGWQVYFDDWKTQGYIT